MTPHLIRSLAFSLVWLASIAGISGEPSIRAIELKCENDRAATGIDIAEPRLSWKLYDGYLTKADRRGSRQTAYQIQVYSPEAAASKLAPDLWDSGKVISDQTHSIPYAGKKLESSQPAYWKVRVWDENDRPSESIDGGYWLMGILNESDWRAKWICAQSSSDSLLLRKEFVVKPGLKRAVAHVTGLGQYEMSINGAKADKNLLTPGWTDYNDTILYDSQDISSRLVEGQNAVGLTLGNGMYHVERRNRFAKFTGSFGPLRAICQIELEYRDGTKEFIVTDETWRTHPGAITYNSIFGGEDFDARLYPRGWNRSGFDDAEWKNAVGVVRPSGKLRGHSVASEPLQEIESHRVVAEKKLSENVSVYDFGQNASHMPKIRVTGPAGSTVRLIPAEVVNADGSIQRSTMGSTNRGISWWQYTKATDDAEEWFPQFYYVGCRYMQAELIPARGDSNRFPKIENLEAAVVHSTAEATGTFECSNTLLNEIRDLVRWAQRANMVSVLTDCPHREKLGWLEQYHLNGPAIRYEFDMARMFTKGMNDMADAQTDTGLVPNIAPEYVEFHPAQWDKEGAFRDSPEWGSAFILVPWQQYQFTGDIELLRRHYDDMKRYVTYLGSRATNHIVNHGLGDWYDIGPKPPGFAQLTPKALTATAFYQHDAWVLSQAAKLLGKSSDARSYSKLSEQIRLAFNREFFDPATQSYSTGSQCANSIPLVMNLCEPEHRSAVLKNIVADVQKNNLTAGDVGYRYLLRALAEGGRSDVIYAMNNQSDKPGYGYQLRMGATSLTEAWDARRSSSQNHFMLGQIMEWFYADLAGIATDPESPGFKNILIQPQPVGDVTWARASFDSVRGKIVSDWRRDGNKFTLRVVIPPNCTARVSLPAPTGGAVFENGKLIKQSRFEKVQQLKSRRAIVEIGSGSYEFTTTY